MTSIGNCSLHGREGRSCFKNPLEDPRRRPQVFWQDSPTGAASSQGERRSLLVIHQRFNRLLYFFQRHGVPLHELSGKTLYRSPVVADDLASLTLQSP